MVGECGHVSNCSWAAGLIRLYSTGVRRAVLGHLSEHNNYEQLALETVRQALRAADIPDEDFELSIAHRGRVGEMYEV